MNLSKAGGISKSEEKKSKTVLIKKKVPKKKVYKSKKMSLRNS